MMLNPPAGYYEDFDWLLLSHIAAMRTSVAGLKQNKFIRDIISRNKVCKGYFCSTVVHCLQNRYQAVLIISQTWHPAADSFQCIFRSTGISMIVDL